MTGQHTDVGAYALGLLEPADRQEFERHLAGCPECAAEVAELSGMRDLLTGIAPDEATGGEPAEADVVSLVQRQALAQRRRRRWQAGLSAAACVALLAAGAAVGLAAAPGGATPPAALTHVIGTRHTATDPRTGVTGTVGLVAKPWGTQVTLDLSKIRGPLECELIAVSATGQRQIASGWFVPAAGYGVPGHPAHLLVAGGTAIHAGNLSRLDVIIVGGRTLVSIPA
jgi:hypothetical protein